MECARNRYGNNTLIRSNRLIRDCMDIRYTDHRIIVSEKELTALDRFVLDVITILEPKTRYVIVSGYVAILFGRSRGTEDVDILIPHLDEDAFRALHRAFIQGGYEFLNAEDASGLYDMLTHRMGIRFAKKEQFIPNIELKFLKDDVDRTVLQERIEVCLPEKSVFISPIEIQIAYKLYLGSEKDIEDALYLWEIFKDDLDLIHLRTWMKNLNVKGDEYGLCI
jgi:hypothetical protein